MKAIKWKDGRLIVVGPHKPGKTGYFAYWAKTVRTAEGEPRVVDHDSPGWTRSAHGETVEVAIENLLRRRLGGDMEMFEGESE